MEKLTEEEKEVRKELLLELLWDKDVGGDLAKAWEKAGFHKNYPKRHIIDKEFAEVLLNQVKVYQSVLSYKALAKLEHIMDNPHDRNATNLRQSALAVLNAKKEIGPQYNPEEHRAVSQMLLVIPERKDAKIDSQMLDITPISAEEINT